MRPNDKTKAVFLTAYVGSSVLFVGICFGFLRMLTELPLWACVLISLPSGVLAFRLLLRLQESYDGPLR